MNPGNTDSSGRRVGLGVAGGIAAYKAVEVLRGLQKAGCRVRVAMTARATEFIRPLTFRALTDEHVLVDDYAVDNPDPIAHITFSQNLDLLVIAPATANIIAKFANGIADDFLTSTYLAATCPVLIAPAMNTEMLLHPATQRNLERLRADAVHFVEPEAGVMACKTVGPGRLSEPENIVEKALALLKSKVQSPKPEFQTLDSRLPTSDLTGESVLITTGATREEIDPVRFISNHSSGKMGFALAQAARERGAQVTVIAGVTGIQPPEDVCVVRATSAEEMHRAVIKEIETATVFIGAAAVADYRPVARQNQKIKKNNGKLVLTLEPTPDILADVSRLRAKKNFERLLVIGFAAETADVIEHARAKLVRKNLDLIVANDVSQPDAGFNVDTNRITLLTKEDAGELPLMSKSAAAHRILDKIAELRRKGEENERIDR